MIVDSTILVPNTELFLASTITNPCQSTEKGATTTHLFTLKGVIRNTITAVGYTNLAMPHLRPIPELCPRLIHLRQLTIRRRQSLLTTHTLMRKHVALFKHLFPRRPELPALQTSI